MSEKVEKTDAEWRAALTPEQYEVMRRKGTERAFGGAYWNCHEDGIYRCASCGAELFDASDKFDSGSGWPSFTRAIADGRIRTEEDRSHGMLRVEAVCARCDAHLGHVFPDGPPPTGTRFCINSISLDLARKADR